MPYIKAEERNTGYNETPGKLAFHMTLDIVDFLDEQRCHEGEETKAESNNFQQFATAVGVLELVKLELWKRLISPYEDKKREENGDVY